jgi:hypothetical protein
MEKLMRSLFISLIFFSGIMILAGLVNWVNPFIDSYLADKLVTSGITIGLFGTIGILISENKKLQRIVKESKK